MTQFVQTPKSSVFGGLILPESHVADMLKNVVAGHGAYSSTRRDNKNVVNWETSKGSADSDTLFDRDKISHQARDLDRNDSIATGAINTAVTNVIGEGLRARAQINYEYLGLTYDEAEKKQKEFDFYFNIWANSANADVSRVQNFYEMQDLIERSYLISGDVGVLRRSKARSGSMFKTCVQVIEADRISDPRGSVGKNIRGGVEFDLDGEPVAYHVSKNHPGELWHPSLSTSALDWVRVPAFDDAGVRMFLHVFMRLRPGQNRGISYLAPIIEPLKQLSRYRDAEITAAVIAACFSVAITTESPSTGINAFGGGVPGVVNGTQVTPPGTSLSKLEPGLIFELGKGEDVKTIDTNRPNSNFDPFVLAVVRNIGMALEIPYEILIKHYSSSFTAARAAILDLIKYVRKRRAFSISRYCNPVREWVISECILEGMIDAPKFFEDPIAKAAWLKCGWSGPTMGHINPSVEADAENKWVGMGYKSVSEGAMEHFGNDWEEVADQRERELKRYIKLPVLANTSLVTQPVDPDQKAPTTPQPLPSDGGSDNDDETRNGGNDGA